MENKRKYGLDIVRILAMVLITAIHFVAYSGIMQVPHLTDYNRVLLSVVSALFTPAVNLFVLITGYFSCEKKLNGKRLFSLWIQVFSVGLVLTAVGALFLKQPFGIVTLLKTVFPLSTMHYWFFTMYILLMLFSPLINLFINALTQQQHKWLCIAGFFVICVFFVSNPFFNAQYYVADARGFVWLCYIYMLGAGFKKYGWELSRKKSLLGICLAWGALTVLKFFQMDQIASAKFLDGNSVLPFLFSLFLFFFFKSIEIKASVGQKLISWLSSCSFLVYVLQEHDMIREWYWHLFNIPRYADSPGLILTLLLSLLALWPIALLLQWLFRLITPFIDALYEKGSALVRKALSVWKKKTTKGTTDH